MVPALLFTLQIEFKLVYGPFVQTRATCTVHLISVSDQQCEKLRSYCPDIRTFSWHLILSHFTLTQDYVGGLDNGRRHWSYLYLPLLAFASKEHHILLIRKTFAMVASLAFYCYTISLNETCLTQQSF